MWPRTRRYATVVVVLAHVVVFLWLASEYRNRSAAPRISSIPSNINDDGMLMFPIKMDRLKIGPPIETKEIYQTGFEKEKIPESDLEKEKNPESYSYDKNRIIHPAGNTMVVIEGNEDNIETPSKEDTGSTGEASRKPGSPSDDGRPTSNGQQDNVPIVSIKGADDNPVKEQLYPDSKHVDESSSSYKEDNGPSTQVDVIRTDSKTECEKFQTSLTHPKDEIFQPIAGSKSYVFSAFAISQSTVRVIFLNNKESDSLHSFSCLFRRANSADDVISKNIPTSSTLPVLDTVPGKVARIKDDHKKLYTAAFMYCPISPKTLAHIGDLALSITYGECKEKPASNLIPVQNVQQPQVQKPWEFTVCVSPFHSKYRNTDDLVEMIELNRILGAEHFYFYNASCSEEIAEVLAYYQKEGFIHLIQWHIPEYPTTDEVKDTLGQDQTKPMDIHYLGQNAAINDCLYRNRNRSKFVVIQDLDEFIIPHNPNITTWSQFVQSRLALDPNKTNFQVRSSYYRKEWIHPENKFPLLKRAEAFRSVVLRNVQREENIFGYRARSKYIVNPLLVNEGGIHYVHRHPEDLTDYVPESEALVHHYRTHGNPAKPLVRIFDDIIIRRYGERLIKAVETTRKQIGLKDN